MGHFISRLCWIAFLAFVLTASRPATGITLSCQEPDSYYNSNPNCTYRGVNISDVAADISFTGYHYSSRYNFRFVDSQLFEVPKRIFETFSVQFLHVAMCGIESVSRFTFEKAGSLMLLNMSSNSISELSNYVFTGAARLSILDLSHNNISSIEEKAFSNLNGLYTLLLTGNRIKAMPDSVFIPLVNLKKLSMASNELEVLQKNLFQKNKQLTMLFIQRNKLVLIEKDVFANLGELEYLWLKENNLTSFEFPHLNVKRMSLSNNQLKRLELSAETEILYAGNNSITEIITDPEVSYKLHTLDLSSNNLSSIKVISNLTALEILDLSFNTLGSLELTSFSKLSKLKDLNLENTKISNLKHGTFSHQTALQRLDISYNNLNQIDLDIFTSSSDLEELFLEGNRLKDINYVEIHKIFPALNKISIADNNWNCTFLTKMIRSLNTQRILVGGFKTENLIADKTNVKGIYCSDDTNPLTDWTTAVKHLDKKLNESVTIVDATDVKEVMKKAIDEVGNFFQERISLLNKTDSMEREIYDLKLKISQMETELLNMKHSIVELKLSQLTNVSNETNHISGDLRIMMQEMNNITLEKLKLAREALEVKILSETLKVDSCNAKVRENSNNLISISNRLDQIQQASPPAWSNHGPVAVQQQLRSSPESNNSSAHASEVLIIVLLVVLIVLIGACLLVIYRNKLIFGQRRGTHYGTSNTLATMMDNDI